MLSLLETQHVKINSFDGDLEDDEPPPTPDSGLATLKLWQIKDILYEATIDIAIDETTKIQPPSPAQFDTQTISGTSVDAGIGSVNEVPSPAHQGSNDLVTDSDLSVSIATPAPSLAPDVQHDTIPRCRNSVNSQKRCPSRAPKVDRAPAIPTRRSGRKVQVPIRYDPCPESRKLIDATMDLPQPNRASNENHSKLGTCVNEDLLQVLRPVTPKRIRNDKPKPRLNSSKAGITDTVPNDKNLIRAMKAPSVRPKRDSQSKCHIRPKRNLKAPSRLTAEVFGSWK